MANKKSTKPKSAKPVAKSPAPKPSKPAPSAGFTPVSKTIITTFQNANGVRRTVKETTVAPGKKKSQTQSKKGAKKK